MLHHHFEHHFHVHHRLRAGPRVDHPETGDVEQLVAIITGEFCRPVAYQPVAADGAARAAASFAWLL
ncbi:MAG TPA: hypothetical protein VFV63_10890 [Ilumatobacteraceae bacterium]|nr:hypothetical protein [Ilumatobacteraceae bacterium]